MQIPTLKKNALSPRRGDGGRRAIRTGTGSASPVETRPCYSRGVKEQSRPADLTAFLRALGLCAEVGRLISAGDIALVESAWQIPDTVVSSYGWLLVMKDGTGSISNIRPTTADPARPRRWSSLTSEQTSYIPHSGIAQASTGTAPITSTRISGPRHRRCTSGRIAGQRGAGLV